jgi:hypothetical protein
MTVLIYNIYQYSRLYAGIYYVYGTPQQEDIEYYEEGKRRVLIKLDASIKFINEKLEDTGGVTQTRLQQCRRKRDRSPIGYAPIFGC